MRRAWPDTDDVPRRRFTASGPIAIGALSCTEDHYWSEGSRLLVSGRLGARLRGRVNRIAGIAAGKWRLPVRRNRRVPWNVVGAGGLSIRLVKPAGAGVKDPHDGPGRLEGYRPGLLRESGVVGSCGWWPRTGPVKWPSWLPSWVVCLAYARSCRFGWTVKKRVPG